MLRKAHNRTSSWLENRTLGRPSEGNRPLLGTSPALPAGGSTLPRFMLPGHYVQRGGGASRVQQPSKERFRIEAWLTLSVVLLALFTVGGVYLCGPFAVYSCPAAIPGDPASGCDDVSQHGYELSLVPLTGGVVMVAASRLLLLHLR